MDRQLSDVCEEFKPRFIVLYMGYIYTIEVTKMTRPWFNWIFYSSSMTSLNQVSLAAGQPAWKPKRFPIFSCCLAHEKKKNQIVYQVVTYPILSHSKYTMTI